MVEPLPSTYIWSVSTDSVYKNKKENTQPSSHKQQNNGGPWAAVDPEVRGGEAERPLQVERSHSRPAGEGGGGLQTEAQVFLHEPLREVQGQGSEAVETDVTNTQNCNHHGPGRTQISSVSVG